jgi:hypothetical protein
MFVVEDELYEVYVNTLYHQGTFPVPANAPQLGFEKKVKSWLLM